MSPLFRAFESWIDPFREPSKSDMPHGGFAFLMYFVTQVRWPFIAMLAIGGATAFVEVAIFNFLGRIV
ncbi:MAG: ABC transporter ATP-binding protein, partial [Pseudomonadota bacterium]|nr:ABC transporter ATP-binding protein [Pseudomonadota bacterium]